MPRIIVLLSVICALTFGLGLGTPPAEAHARLITSTPAAGTTVTAIGEVALTFNEPVKLIAHSIVDAMAQAVKGFGKPRVEGNTIYIPVTEKLGAGTYKVNYRVAGPDAHAMNGALSFSVQPKP